MMHQRSPEHRVQRSYQQLASVYDQRWHRYLARTLGFLYAWLQPEPQAHILDVGCGSGLFAACVLRAQPQQRIDGIDLSPEMLAIAHHRCARFPHVTFSVASMTALPFTDRSVDLVVSSSALHYVHDPHAALYEMRRVVKATGSVTILDWCRDYPSSQVLDRVLPWIDPAHQRSLTQAALHRAVRDAGFTITRAQRKRFGLAWGLMIVTAQPLSGAPPHQRRPSGALER